MAATQGRKGLVALFKRGWHEIPEIMGSASMAVLGVALASYSIYKYELTQGPYYKRFKHEYIVFRDDDPRVKLLRTD